MRTDRGRYRLTEIPPPAAGIRGEDYLAYRPLLLRVLGRLARDGYAVPPDDGLDLVHDFFVEAWPEVVTRFDPGKARFQTFLHLSFASFARPRIVKLTRWRTALVDPYDFALSHVLADHVEAQQERSFDVYLVESAVRSMAQHDRVILNFYIHGVHSERQIAHHLGITRYRLRSKLTDIFGNVAAKLGDLGALPEPVSAVVVALWRDHRTAKEAASYLNLTVPEIQAVRTSMFRLLAETVKGRGDIDRMDFMRPREARMAPVVDVEGLLRRAAGEPSEARDEAMAEIGRHAEAVLSHLEGADAGAELSRSDAETLARIYAALAGEEDAEALREAELPYVMAYESAEVLIGEAFRQSLVPGLPPGLRDLSTYFLGLKVADPGTRDRLQSDPTVRHGGPSAGELVPYGLTPARLATAAYAIASLARRVGDEDGLRPGSVMRFGDRAEDGQATVDLGEAYGQVALVAELDGESARRVTSWLLKVAEFVPLLFDDFVAEPGVDGVRLMLTDETEGDLLVRWRATAPEDRGHAVARLSAS